MCGRRRTDDRLKGIQVAGPVRRSRLATFAVEPRWRRPGLTHQACGPRKCSLLCAFVVQRAVRGVRVAGLVIGLGSPLAGSGIGSGDRQGD